MKMIEPALANLPNETCTQDIPGRETVDRDRNPIHWSLVLLKNDNEVLPIAKDTPLVYVAGRGADDIGLQSGGWTIAWQGSAGDRAKLDLSKKDMDVIQNVRDHGQKVVVVILSGRPLIITDQLEVADGWVAAWLPGSEGQGIAEVLFGDYPFTGKLPVSWPRSMDQVPVEIDDPQAEGCQGPLFPMGYGIDTESAGTTEWLNCD